MEKFFESVRKVLQGGWNFVVGVHKYAAKLRPFVVVTAQELEALIPDSGMGNVKLLAFDQALKVFVAASSDFDEEDVEEGGQLWTVAHWLLESWLAAQRVQAQLAIMKRVD